MTVRMDREMQVDFQATRGTEEMGPAHHLTDVTPHGMVLVALGTCTCLLLHDYARRREMPLEGIEIRLWFEECHDCSQEGPGGEQVRMELDFDGDLDEKARKKLLAVSRQCPIHHMLHGGVPVHTEISGVAAADGR